MPNRLGSEVGCSRIPLARVVVTTYFARNPLVPALFLQTPMRAVILVLLAGVLWGQPIPPPYNPAYAPLTRAYDALHAHDYDTAIANFLKAGEAAPSRASIRKDLGYAYIKVGENILAREQFRQAMTLDPSDTQVALEYAFLCNDTKEQAQARRIFDRLRKTGNATAERAFQAIDAPLAAGIERWKKAIEMGANNFSAHYELATLAEQRDDLALAAEHYEKAWRLRPERRYVLVDLGRALKAAGQEVKANAALLAASRGGESRAEELARELLPDRYPYVPEFRSALELDPPNVGLRRELAFLLLQMNHAAEAELELRALADPPVQDLLSIAQLGLLLYARGDRAEATPLFQRVLDSDDEDLSNRVRDARHLPHRVLAGSTESANDAKTMAARSLQAGYMKDALRYFELALEEDPGDYAAMLQLGWTNNILHHDVQAFHWFDLARRSPDPKIAQEAAHARDNLRESVETLRTTAWFYPMFSTRWHDQFGYAQVKTEIRTRLPIRPYLSVRFVGDTRETIGKTTPGVAPQYLSENAFILGAGVRTIPWHGVTGWFEAGSSMSYVTGHMLPDYRGGISAARSVGHTLGSEGSGAFADSTLDAIFVSRFGNDSLLYSQSRFGYTVGPHSVRVQFYWNANATIDTQRQY